MATGCQRRKELTNVQLLYHFKLLAEFDQKIIINIVAVKQLQTLELVGIVLRRQQKQRTELQSSQPNAAEKTVLSGTISPGRCSRIRHISFLSILLHQENLTLLTL